MDSLSIVTHLSSQLPGLQDASIEADMASIAQLFHAVYLLKQVASGTAERLWSLSVRIVTRLLAHLYSAKQWRECVYVECPGLVTINQANPSAKISGCVDCRFIHSAIIFDVILQRPRQPVAGVAAAAERQAALGAVLARVRPQRRDVICRLSHRLSCWMSQGPAAGHCQREDWLLFILRPNCRAPCTHTQAT